MPEVLLVEGAGALLAGAGVACALAAALGRSVLRIHDLKEHLLSPSLSADPPEFPFVALLVSGGHTQLMQNEGEGVIKPKGLAVVGYALGALTKALLALARTTGVVVTAGLLARVGKGVRGAPRDGWRPASPLCRFGTRRLACARR